MTDEREEEGDQVERKSGILEKAYVKTAEEVLGYKKKKQRKPWFSQETWALGRPKESHQTEVDQCKISETKAEMARRIPTKGKGNSKTG